MKKRLWGITYTLRLTLVAAAILGLHTFAKQRDFRSKLNQSPALQLSSIKSLLPQATLLKPFSMGASSWYSVQDAAGHEIAFALTTSPDANDIIGYSGPNNVLLLLDDQQRVKQAMLLTSGDTQDHVHQVEDAKAFWNQFVGLAMGKPNDAKVDAVSGATLTSLAIAEAIQLRVSGRRQSLRFPDSISLEEARLLLPAVASLGDSDGGGLVPLYDSAHETLGWIARTGPLVDSEEGYQGPTELLLLVDRNQVVLNLKIRKSYDNEPYVSYVRQEYSFWSRFKGRSLTDLAELDIEREEIEGVSGATMTSLAVARTIASSLEKLTTQQEQRDAKRSWNWSLTEAVTVAVVLAGMFWSRSPWRGRRWPRRVWQVACFLLLGLFAGNLLSLALIAGWTRGGVQWMLAPGLSLLLITAFVWPIFTKENLYCDHLCPHGAIQQWMIRKRSHGDIAFGNRPKRTYIFKVAYLVLGITPLIAIAAALTSVLFQWPIPLAWLEPFDAYSWRIGLSVSSLVWILAIGCAYFRPMSYCRLMCPTGKLIRFVRRGERSRFSWLADTLVALLVIATWWLNFTQ